MYKRVMFHDTEEWCKILREFRWEKDMRNMANFHQSTQNWDFDGILLSKEENAWS